MRDVHKELYPELRAGGFTRVDGAIQFYGRIQSLLQPEFRVLDFGAGRGRVPEDPVSFRKDLRTLRGKCAEVVGVDVAEAVLSNPMVDSGVVVSDSSILPFQDDYFDMIVADWVFEHIDDPIGVGRELARVLKPSGWICARTPNRWGTTGLGARLTPNRFHVAALRRLQPHKSEVDTFPTRYKLNTRKQLITAFPLAEFDHAVYTHQSHPTYAGRSYFASRAFQAIGAVTPPGLRPTLMVFLQRKPVECGPAAETALTGAAARSAS